MKKIALVLYMLMSSLLVAALGNAAADKTSWITGSYSINQTLSKELRIYDATKLKVKIIGKTEANYDFVYVYDEDNKLVNKISGDIDTEFVVDGSSITVRLVSDDATTDTGIAVAISKASTINVNSRSLIVTNHKQIDRKLGINGADRLLVTIYGKSEIDSYLTIKNSQGNVVKRISGRLSETFVVDGSYIVASYEENEVTTENTFTVNVEKFDGNMPKITSWITGTYSNNEIMVKNLKIDGASSLKVMIKGKTEKNADYIYIYNEAGDLVKKVSGNINEVITVAGSSITAKLEADDSTVDSGVLVTIMQHDSANGR